MIINGGITTLESSIEHLKKLDGVMLGREIYHNPYLLAQVDNQIFGQNNPLKTRAEIVHLLIPYLQTQLAQGVRSNSISRHLLGLFQGEKGARGWRRYLSENATKPHADEQVLLQALKFTE